MTYFAVLGKNPKLSLRELQLVQPTDIIVNGHLAVFNTTRPEYLSSLAGIIKRGEVIGRDRLEDALDEVELIGVEDKKLGMILKKKYGIKRFKQIDLDTTDREILSEWKEIVEIPFRLDKATEIKSDREEYYGIVQQYQDIKRFEVIDMEKPLRGMEIGMMPAKLTQILVNIAVGESEKEPASGAEVHTIYDPFCGFGTTWFVANSLGCHFIGSDIVITSAKQNLQRWKTTAYAQERHMTLFKHDIFEVLDKPFLKAVDIIVTEGRLWPVVNHQMTQAELQRNLIKIQELYRTFVEQIAVLYPHITVVMTLPEYQKKWIEWLNVTKEIREYAIEKWFEVEIFPELYLRKGQLIWRRVMILKK